MKDTMGGKQLVFVGAGNMAEALVKGIVKAGTCRTEQVTVTDPLEERRRHFESTYGVKATADNAGAAAGADVLVLAVKPQVMGEALEQIRETLPGDALVVSIAAGITAGRIEEGLSPGCRVVRVMPNTPSLVGMGAAGIAGGREATDDDLALAETLLGAVGAVVRVDEKDLDAVTALSGSGPAYVFYLMEAMLTAAESLGQDAERAKSLVYATVEGAARLVQETGLPPDELRRRVTSKGGTTEAALGVMNERGVGEAITAAVERAAARSRELSAM
jgi:pyrroline-5-carboxylate reductase